jgi:hypothetical protein
MLSTLTEVMFTDPLLYQLVGMTPYVASTVKFVPRGKSTQPRQSLSPGEIPSNPPL